VVCGLVVICVCLILCCLVIGFGGLLVCSFLVYLCYGCVFGHVVLNLLFVWVACWVYFVECGGVLF